MTKSVTDRLHTVNRKWKTNVKSEIPRLQGLKSTTAMDGNCKSPSSFFPQKKTKASSYHNNRSFNLAQKSNY
jgi:hypothetical protein